MNAITKPLVAKSTARGYQHPIEVTVARTLNDMMQVIAIRSVIYMAEQNCPYSEEYDGNDFAGATHLVARSGGEPVGVMRIRWFGEFAKLERLAVLSEHRGGRATQELIQTAIRLAARKGYRKILGHCQPRLVAFWERKFNAKPLPNRQPFVFSDYEYTEMAFDIEPPENALTIEADPMVLLRPEGDWDQPGVLDRSASRSGGEY